SSSRSFTSRAKPGTFGPALLSRWISRGWPYASARTNAPTTEGSSRRTDSAASFVPGFSLTDVSTPPSGGADVRPVAGCLTRRSRRACPFFEAYAPHLTSPGNNFHKPLILLGLLAIVRARTLGVASSRLSGAATCLRAGSENKQ